MGANSEVSGANTGCTIVGEIGVLIFVLHLFGAVWDRHSVVGTSNEGDCSGSVVVAALEASRVVTTHGTFSVVVIVVVTWNAAVVAAAASGALLKGILLPCGRTLFVRSFFFCIWFWMRVLRFPLA